jgi:hypothetical protein
MKTWTVSPTTVEVAMEVKDAKNNRGHYIGSPNSRGTNNSNIQQSGKGTGRGGGRGRGGRGHGRGRAGNQHYRRVSLNTVSKWLSDVDNEGNHITSEKASPRASNVVEAIGVSNNNTKHAMNTTHDHTEVNFQTTKNAHHNAMGATDPEPHSNNPTQTENSSTDRKNRLTSGSE